MSIYWRKNADGTATAYIEINIAGVPRLRESTGIRDCDRDARKKVQEYHDRRRAELWRRSRYGERPRYTWEEAVSRWFAEHQHKRSLDKDQQRLRWLDTHLRGTMIDELDREAIEAVMLVKEAEGSSPATVNRHAALVRSILNAAAGEWGWLRVAPKVRMRREDNDRITWMTQDEAYGFLLPELASTAPHLYDAAEFTLQTGLREQNVAGLRWDQVNADNSACYCYHTKNGRPLGTPLNEIARAVLARREGMHPVYVFTYKGERVGRFNNHAWQKAVARAMKKIGEPLAKIGQPMPERLDGFTWHSLRHTWASWMVQNGCPLEVLQKLGGWRKLDMVLRYAHLATSHLEPYSGLAAQGIGGPRIVK